MIDEILNELEDEYYQTIGSDKLEFYINYMLELTPIKYRERFAKAMLIAETVSDYHDILKLMEKVVALDYLQKH